MLGIGLRQCPHDTHALTNVGRRGESAAEPIDENLQFVFQWIRIPTRDRFSRAEGDRDRSVARAHRYVGLAAARRTPLAS